MLTGDSESAAMQAQEQVRDVIWSNLLNTIWLNSS